MYKAPELTTKVDYDLLLKAMPALYLILSPEFNILDATESYLQATLTVRQEIIGRHIFDVFPENPNSSGANAVANLQLSLQHVLQHRTPHVMPVQRYDILRPASLGGGFEERYWLPVNTPVLGADGGLLYIIHEASDVTIQQMAHYNIESCRERMELLALAANDSIWDWDLLSNDIWWNNTFEDIFGLERHAVASIEAISERIHPDDRENVRAGIYNIINQGAKIWSDTYRFQLADSSYTCVLNRGYVLRDEKGMAYRMVGTMLNLSNQLSGNN